MKRIHIYVTDGKEPGQNPVEFMIAAATTQLPLRKSLFHEAGKVHQRALARAIASAAVSLVTLLCASLIRHQLAV